MPVLGVAKRRHGERLGSGACAGEGSQNLLCAPQAVAAVLIRQAANGALRAWSPDGVVALGLAAFAVTEARGSWRCCTDGCCGGG
jgi:hypothetical protein